MRVLFVASYNKGCFSSFIIEQAKALEKQGCVVDFYGLQGRGGFGYLKNLPKLKKKIREFNPDVLHAHYGLTGLLANLQWKTPVVTTYHGSDINDRRVLPFSRITMHLSAWNIFVSPKTLAIAKPRKKYCMLPCGVDFSDLQLTEKGQARRKMNLQTEKKYILFSGAFDNVVKNAPLAKEAAASLNDGDVELLELKGYSREEVTLLMCAADSFLMTSFSEGSPQVIKEAMACGCPIVSVDVGDVKERVDGVDGCYVAKTRTTEELCDLLEKALAFSEKTKGREKLIVDGMDNILVAQHLIGFYEKVLRDENH